MCNYRKVRMSLSLQRECGFWGVSEIQSKISRFLVEVILINFMKK